MAEYESEEDDMYMEVVFFGCVSGANLSLSTCLMFQGTVARVGNRSKESTSLGMTAAEEQAKRTPAQERELIEKSRNPVSLTHTHAQCTTKSPTLECITFDYCSSKSFFNGCCSPDGCS